MKTFLNAAGWLAVVAAVVVLAGCGRKSPSAQVVAEQLQQSYGKADSPVKEAVAQAGAALQAGDYTRAISTMNRVTQGQAVDPAQKQAVDLLIYKTQQAVRQNPQINNAELHKATARLIMQVHGEN